MGTREILRPHRVGAERAVGLDGVPGVEAGLLLPHPEAASGQVLVLEVEVGDEPLLARRIGAGAPLAVHPGGPVVGGFPLGGRVGGPQLVEAAAVEDPGVDVRGVDEVAVVAERLGPARIDVDHVADDARLEPEHALLAGPAEALDHPVVEGPELLALELRRVRRAERGLVHQLEPEQARMVAQLPRHLLHRSQVVGLKRLARDRGVVPEVVVGGDRAGRGEEGLLAGPTVGQRRPVRRAVGFVAGPEVAVVAVLVEVDEDPHALRLGPADDPLDPP